jgi:hypothetical protein
VVVVAVVYVCVCLCMCVCVCVSACACLWCSEKECGIRDADEASAALCDADVPLRSWKKYFDLSNLPRMCRVDVSHVDAVLVAHAQTALGLARRHAPAVRAP